MGVFAVGSDGEVLAQHGSVVELERGNGAAGIDGAECVTELFSGREIDLNGLDL